MEKPAIKKILQISMIVDDLDAYMRRWNDEYGIGPWTILQFNEKTLLRQHIKGKDEPWAMRMATCDALNVQLELIQPLYGESDYMVFLREHGPGLHHIAIEPAGGFPVWAEGLKARGVDHFLLGGREQGAQGQREFEYVDLRADLGTIFETYYDTNGFVPGPAPFAGTYPPSDEQGKE